MSALREGYTTGSCAAAAAKAAILLLAEDRTAESVEFPLPDGQRRRQGNLGVGVKPLGVGEGNPGADKSPLPETGDVQM